MAALSLRNVGKRFNRQTVIDGVSLEIADREFAVLVGPSGCGKSTLLRLIAGLEAPDSGDILIGGERVNDWTPRERGIAMVFQSYALYPTMTAYDNMAFGLRQVATDRTEIDRRVRQAAERLQIVHLLARKPAELSGGQRQRVAIGRAIVREPRLFLFDEPLSNLDAGLRAQMRLEFMELHRELGTTMVYVTHDQAEAMTLAGTIIVMRNGRVEQIGRPLEVYDRPCNRFVAEFIGSPGMNMIGCRIEATEATGTRIALADKTRLILPLDTRRATANDAATLGVRPEHLHQSSAEDAIGATVTAVERLGSESLVHAALSMGERITWRAAGSHTANAGDILRLAFDAGRCQLFDGEGKAFAPTRSATRPGS